MEPMLTVEDVARVLNVSESSIRRWLRSGFLSGVQVGDQWRIERSELDDFIRRNRPSKKEDQGE